MGRARQGRAREGHGLAAGRRSMQRWLTEANRGKPALVARLSKMIETTPAEGFTGWGQAIQQLDITDRLKAITLPTRVIVGAEDPATPPAAAEAIHRQIAGSDLIVMPGVSHMLCAEDPAAFHNHVIAFLDKQRQIGAGKRACRGPGAGRLRRLRRTCGGAAGAASRRRDRRRRPQRTGGRRRSRAGDAHRARRHQRAGSMPARSPRARCRRSARGCDQRVGPYQGQDYRLARPASPRGVHYVDLADARAFVTGIAALDEAARRAGVLVVSGASRCRPCRAPCGRLCATVRFAGARWRS